MNKTIEVAQAEQWAQEFKNDRMNAILQNAVIHNELKKVSLNHERVVEHQMRFPNEVNTGDIISQRQSLRCWLFASLNFLREKTIKDNNLKSDFAYSTCYITFWDKMEKANYFLEEVLTYGEEITKLDFGINRLSNPVTEGGEWFMFCNILKKYGAVPMEVMPETLHSWNSTDMNKFLIRMMRNGASELTHMMNEGADEETLRAKKEEILKKLYKFLCCTLGTPPTTFTYEYYDKDDNYCCIENVTPKEFVQKFWKYDVDEYQAVVNTPGKTRPYNKVYTLGHYAHQYEGDKSNFYNIPMDEVKELVLKQLADGEGVVFGCDSLNMTDRPTGVLSADIFELDEMFGLDYKMSKEEMLEYREANATHIMVIVGVKEFADGRRYWKIENSWGTDLGKKGFFMMDESYMDLYSYQFIINKKYFNERQLKESAQEAIELKFDDTICA